MEKLFTALTEAIEKAPALALTAAFVWGILSILLSPCHLASVPLVVGFMGGIENLRASRGAVIASVFAAGIFITIAVVGAVTALLGGLVGDVGSAGNYVVAIVLFVIGLHLLGVIPMPWSGGGRLMPKRKGLVGAFVLGLLFGVAVGPCTFAYFMPVLGFAFLSGQTNALYGTVLVAVTAIGHCSVIIAAGTAAGALQRYLNWSESSRATAMLKK
ncbi:MAG: cytochrome c biogenesis protein CcdA, partial [bacterium]|nr:cytochrome c biogenesis protein CcdA [bacterium]